MENLRFLFLAYAAIWSGLFIFMLQIARRLSNIERRIDATSESGEKK